MYDPSIRFIRYFAFALLAVAPQAVAMDAVPLPASTAAAMAQAASPQAIADYRRKLKEYLEFHHRETARPQRQAARASGDQGR
jgi:hypothetical protein